MSLVGGGIESYNETMDQLMAISYHPELKIYGIGFDIHEACNDNLELINKTLKIENKWEVRNLIKQGYKRVK